MRHSNKSLKVIKMDPKVLKDLYWKRGLTLDKIAKKLGCSQGKVLYWMMKHDISRRSVSEAKRVYNITRNTLIKLYVKKKMSSLEIARKFGIKSHDTVLNYLKRYNIPRRTYSEIRTKYPKKEFSSNLNEKAYMLGLRTGDISANGNHNMVRVCTTTTHAAQVEMFKNTFEKYSHIHIHPAWNRDHSEWRIYCDLNRSFNFLLNKIKKIPDWILNNREIFYSFLAGYMDCEGSWGVRKSNKNNIRFSFRLRTGDKTVLVQLSRKLKELNYKSHFYLVGHKGTVTNKGKYNRDFFGLSIWRRKDVVRLAKILITLSKHKEKIMKMGLILKESKNKQWNTVESKVLKMRKKIKKEHINSLGVNFYS